MNMPFCDVCPLNVKCVPDLQYFHDTTGNRRIPPEEYCKAQYEKFETPFDDFYKKVLIRNTENIMSLIPLYPEIRPELEKLQAEEKEKMDAFNKANGIVPEHDTWFNRYPSFYKERVRRPVVPSFSSVVYQHEGSK